LAVERDGQIDRSNRSERSVFVRIRFYGGREKSGRHDNKPADNRATIGNEFNIRKELHAIRSGLASEESTGELREFDVAR
jgi:hypothetical protein